LLRWATDTDLADERSQNTDEQANISSTNRTGSMRGGIWGYAAAGAREGARNCVKMKDVLKDTNK